jgi:hypothetical protein
MPSIETSGPTVPLVPQADLSEQYAREAQGATSADLDEFCDQYARAHAREWSPGPLNANPIAAMFESSLRGNARSKRKRGRPRKKDVSFFVDVLRGHLGVVAWHQETYGVTARSDAALYRAFRRHVAEGVEVDSVVASAARDAALDPRLKTVLNTLSEARAFFRKHPEKCPFSGTDVAKTNDSNDGLAVR